MIVFNSSWFHTDLDKMQRVNLVLPRRPFAADPC